MAPRICRSTDTQTTIGNFSQMAFDIATRSVGGALLNPHALPDYNITSTTAIVIGDESVDLTLTTPPAGVTTATLYAGEILRFPNPTVGQPPIAITLLETVEVGATAVPVAILPAAAALAANAVARTKGLELLEGCYNATLSPQYKVEDKTDYLSGMGKEDLILQAAMQVNLEINLSYDNKLHDRMLQVIYDYDHIGTHCYLLTTLNSGERYEGYALITSATPQAAVQTKRSIQIQANYQGMCFQHKLPNVL
jgi:hypothetical protein